MTMSSNGNRTIAEVTADLDIAQRRSPEDWAYINKVHRALSRAKSPESPESPGVWTPFPVDLLPWEVRDYVRAQAAALHCDPAMIAVPCLPVLAGAIGNAARVRLKKSWEEPATLWTLIIGRSGTLKSPALDAALRPVHALEHHHADQFEYDLQQYEVQVDSWSRLASGKKIVWY